MFRRVSHNYIFRLLLLLHNVRERTAPRNNHCCLSCVQTARAADTRGDLPVCTDSCSTDTIANRSSTRLRLIALFGLVKPSTFTEAHEAEREHEWCGHTLSAPCSNHLAFKIHRQKKDKDSHIHHL
jgi:hypothetical protein